MNEQKTLTKHERALELDKVLAMLAEETSSPGSRERALALTPQHSLMMVKADLARVSDAYTLSLKYGTPRLGGVGDPTGPLKRARAGGILSPAELLRIAGVLRTIRMVSDWRKQAGDGATTLDFLFEGLVPNRYFEDRIGRAIVSEEMIDDQASPELASIRRKIRQAEIRIREQLDKLVRSTTYQKYLQDAIVTIRDGRFVVPVKAEFRGEIKGLIHDTSGSGATVFIEPIAVVEANNEIKVLKGKELEEIDRILAELSDEAGSFCDAIIGSYEILLDLDLYFARASLGLRMKATVPLVADDGVVELRAARHPLIPDKKVVPIDIRVGTDFSTLVITGPNTGGKTVALKTLGLTVLMAMCGMMIPAAENSRVSLFDRVLADIGDEQSIEQSLSTFSAHMTNIIEIQKEADDRTLILVDELGAGTDPVEGAALAIAILEDFKAVGCKVAATTHYAEMKVYALDTEGVENASCEFDVATLRPTYRLLIGLPGRSNAFAISERLGMDSAVVDRARDLVSRENARFEDIVSELEEARLALDREKAGVERLRAAAAESERKAKATLEQVTRDQEKMTEKARADARRIVESVRAQANQLIDELTEIRKQQNSAEFASRASRAKSELRSRLDKLSDAADPVEKSRKPVGKGPSRPLKKGDRVRIVDLNKDAIVIEPGRDGMVQVQAGIIKTTVPLHNLQLIDKKETVQMPKRSEVTRKVSSRGDLKIEDELNVINRTVEEAILEVDSFLDDAVMSGLTTVRIVHGKGTGALRSGIQSHLRHHKQVRTFRSGVYGEGEMGVTIVTLK